MRRMLTCIWLLSLAFVVRPNFANAGSIIVLAGSPNLPVEYEGTGDAVVQFEFVAGCSGFTCTEGDSASGPGGVSGSYLLQGAFPFNLTQTFSGSTTWTVDQLGAPFLFTYISGGTTLLSGNAQLTNFEQALGASSGVFNFTDSVNLTGLGGTLAGLFPGGAVLNLDIAFFSTTNIGTCVGNDACVVPAYISGGEISSAQTPEPGSLLFFGSGMLTLAGMLRRRLLLRGTTKS